jgi:hypothetical protein
VNICLKGLTLMCVALGLVLLVNCGPAKKVESEPQVEPVPQPPSIEELRKPVAKDPAIYKALKVIKEYGRLAKSHISYEKYQKLTGGQENATLDPDWFYDSYKLDTNENGYWIGVTYGTAQRAFSRDPRIEKVMADLPGKSITVELKTPSGRTYLLTDAEADGILDFAQDAKEKNRVTVDVKLLDQMQEKYTWILGLLKKHYK